MLFKFSGQNFAEGFGILKKFQREFRTEIRTEFRSKKHPFKTYFIFQDLYPIKLHDLKLSSKDNYELTKKNEKSERKKPKFTKFLLNNCYLYIVYLLKLVSLELYHIGVIAFLFPTDTDFYFKNFSCTSVLSK